jgi:hypothetical protein
VADGPEVCDLASRLCGGDTEDTALDMAASYAGDTKNIANGTMGTVGGLTVTNEAYFEVYGHASCNFEGTYFVVGAAAGEP